DKLFTGVNVDVLYRANCLRFLFDLFKVILLATVHCDCYYVELVQRLEISYTYRSIQAPRVGQDNFACTHEYTVAVQTLHLYFLVRNDLNQGDSDRCWSITK